MNQNNTSGKLKRVLGFWDSIAISIGIVIGVGIFRVPSEVAAYLTSPLVISAAWIVGGLFSIMGALCFAELAARHPHSGGTYVFLREGYGKQMGFLFAWTEIAILRAGSIAAVAYVFAGYCGIFFSVGDLGEKMIAITLICLLTGINVTGVRLGANVQQVFFLLKVGTLLAMAGVIFALGARVDSTYVATYVGSYVGGTGSISLHQLIPFAAALIPILWTYGGWHESAFMAGEFRETKRELPLSIVVSTLLIMLLYLLMNVAYLQVMPASEMVGRKTIAADVFKQLFGGLGGAIVSVAVLISAFGAVNSTIMTGGRIPFAMARDVKRFAWFGHVHPKLETPSRSLILNGLWASCLVWIGSFSQLLFFTAFAQWLFFGLAAATLLTSRKNSAPVFLKSGRTIIPLVFIGISILVCASTIYHQPTGSLFGLGLIGIGIPLYRWLSR